jgi:hypothetical protein
MIESDVKKNKITKNLKQELPPHINSLHDDVDLSK